MKTLSGWSAQIASGLSALVAIVCPLCIPAVGAFLASVGLGFAVKVSFLQPLLVVLLSFAVFSLAWSSRLHGKWWVLLVGVASAVGIYIGRYVWFSQWLMALSAGFLIGVSILNFRLKKLCGRCKQ